MKQCRVETCFVPDTTCALGHLDIRECPDLDTSAQQDNAIAQTGDEIVLPWSGTALGLVDVGFVTGRGRATIVGVVGPEDAGKTTLLSAWYLLAGRGQATTQTHVFAGSFTLSGWEAVASRMRWAPGFAPQFPAHTSSRLARGQGLLHLAFREGELVRDYLFTDAPGRWFQRWAVNENAADAEGARWISEHSDIFLLVADCAALSAKDKGSARATLQMLARRVAAVRSERPIILVWAKSDIQISQDVEQAVREAVHSQIPDAQEFRTSVVSHGEQPEGQGFGLTTLLDRVLNLRKRKQILPDPGVDSSDPLFLFGAR
jgi:double-GTPase-like protein